MRGWELGGGKGTELRTEAEEEREESAAALESGVCLAMQRKNETRARLFCLFEAAFGALSIFQRPTTESFDQTTGRREEMRPSKSAHERRARAVSPQLKAAKRLRLSNGPPFAGLSSAPCVTTNSRSRRAGRAAACGAAAASWRERRRENRRGGGATNPFCRSTKQGEVVGEKK